MSRTEEFDPEPGRELDPLIRALQPHGGSLTFTSWASVPGAVTVHLHLPEDEYRVRGHEKVPTGGQVEVPTGGQIEVPTLRVVS